jgi:hypothetical protein
VSKLLSILDLVPSWAWALAVITLAALCIRLDIVGMQAQANAQKARADLATLRAENATAMAVEHDRARTEERRLSAALLEAQNELAQEQAGAAGRVADLAGRLRNVARPVSCTTPTTAAPTAASGPDGRTHPGLPGVAGTNLVLVDGQGLAELAAFADSARSTGQTLTQVRKMLRACWQGETF